MTGNQNWVRDQTGVDQNRFVWAGMPGIEGGARGIVGYATVLLSSSVDDWNPTTNQVTFGANAAIRVDLSADVNITGMVPYVGGEVKTLINISASNIITIKNQSGSSQAANQFYVGSDIDIVPGNTAQFWYDPIALNWKLMSLRGGVHSAMPILASGGGVALPGGILGWLEVPANATITGWKLTSLETCTITMDIWKAPFASFPPTVANSITGGNPPSITAGKSNSSTILTGWTKSLTQGDIVMFNLSATDAQAIHVMCSLDVTRNQ